MVGAKEKQGEGLEEAGEPGVKKMFGVAGGKR